MANNPESEMRIQ